MTHQASNPIGQSSHLKKVLIVCSHFWPSIGGIENRLEQFGAALATNGYDVTVLTPAIASRSSATRKGVKILDVDASCSIDGVPAWPYAIRASVMSGDYMACILVQDPLGDIIWSVEGATPPACTRLIIQPVINADGYGRWKDHPTFGTRLAAIFKGVDAAVAMTKSGPEHQFMQQSDIQPVYIPNASSVPEPAGDFRARYGIAADRFVILHVANLYWVKNHVGLLQSLQDMPESWQLVMVGNPSGEPECAQAFIEALAGRPEVLYIPGLSREWVSAAMQAADTIVLSSFGEGSPNTILEAMAQGKPWIATPQCGAANDHAGGIISELADFKQHLSILENNRELRLLLGDLGNQHWQSSLSWPKVVAGWIDLIETGSLQESFEMPAEIKETMTRLKDLFKGMAAKQAPRFFVLPESRHAHRWLDGLRGLEIGPSAQNPFGLNTRFVGMRDEIYQEEDLQVTGSSICLDIEALADNIPLADESEDFVLSSHVVEHCPDVISTLLEWFRLVKKGALIYMIVPQRDAARSDVGREIVAWSHILEDFDNQANGESDPKAGRLGHCHYHVFDIGRMREIVENIFGARLQLVDHLEQDDKIGNGFTLVYRKTVSCSDALPWELWQRFLARRTQELKDRQKDQPLVNIGMVTYNRLEFTRQAIAALLIHTDHRHVLTVIDNNSQDGSKEYLLELKEQGIIKNLVLLEENVGVAKASNLAWSLEPGADYYLKLDNDIVMQKPGWLGAMVRVAKRVPDAGAVGYNFEMASYPLSTLNGIGVREKRDGNLGGACILIPRRTHDRLGFWCEDYGLYGEEDYDYGCRILISGLRNLYMEDEEVGFHLPAGRAAQIDSNTMVACDGMEEEMHPEYRRWKDNLRRENVDSGRVLSNINTYSEQPETLYMHSHFADQYRKAQLTPQGSPVPPRSVKVAVLSTDPQEHACGFYRIHTLFAALPEMENLRGIEVLDGEHVPNIKALQQADLILVQRFFPQPRTRAFLEDLLTMGKPIIYETDDLLTEIPASNPYHQFAADCAPLIHDFASKCSAITVSTSALKERFARDNDQVFVLPNLLDAALWSRTSPPSKGPLVIGFAGTVTHEKDLEELAQVLEALAARHPGAVAFTFMGCASERLARLPGFSYIQFQEDYRGYAAKMQTTPFDIMLVPLQDTPFNRCKSNVKWLEYSACGIAGVYADLPPYSSCVSHGKTGLLAGPEPMQWFEAVNLLIEHPELRRQMAAAARQEVLADYTLVAQAGRFRDAYRSIRTGPVPPAVSIVMPLFNKVELTRHCLAHLEKNTDSSLYELILVDNGSSDGTADYLATLHPGVKLVKNAENLGFAKACNQGAALARGRYLLFLNNDTEPLPGWLEPLIAVLDADPGVAAAGSKLLFPDGSIQHAGVILARDQNSSDPLVAMHIYYKKPGSHPEANIPVCYQALTAACLAVRREAFNAVAGFDEGYWNGYEDVDLCFKLSAAGSKLVYQPQSVLIHFESQSGSERFRKVTDNVRRLHDKWLGKVSLDFEIAADGSLTEGPGLHVAYRPGNTANGSPKVSIVIPAFNQASYTKQCLEALFAVTGQEIPYEVIVVDNASSDWTPEYLKSLEPRISVLANQQNLGFAKACNQGARAARGRFLVFLNNDTVPQSGWLAALVNGAESDAADLVGAKLLYPDGTVQHAGVAFVDPGDGVHVFKGMPGDHPAANRKRFMQCVTGACLLLKRELFLELGGFDEGFVNGYEDVDLCLRALAAGKKILYAPESVLTHFEETSAGRKEKDRHNAERFFSRWGGKIHFDNCELYEAEGLLRPIGEEQAERLHQLLGVNDNAVFIYLQVLSRYPQDTGALLNLGRVCAATGRPGDAIVFLARLLELRPGHPVALQGLARLTGGDSCTEAA